MAIFKLVKNDYDTDEALENVLSYILDAEKSNGYVGGQNLIVDNAIDNIYRERRFFCDKTQKRLYHFIISLEEYEVIAPNELYLLCYSICNYFVEFQLVFAIHRNTENVHVHFALMPLSLTNEKKAGFDHATLYGFLEYIRNLLAKYNIKVKLCPDT